MVLTMSTRYHLLAIQCQQCFLMTQRSGYPYLSHMHSVLDIVIGHYFSLVFFCPFSIQLHFTFLTTFLPHAYPGYVYPLMLHLLTNRRQEHNSIGLLVTEQLVYWATDIPKQSCCGSSSPGSCAGTSSAATERSHHSKFRTSRTWSMSRSASTTRRLLVINRFLTTTAARSA